MTYASLDTAFMKNTILRENYGVQFTKTDNILNGHSFFKHSFAIAIPNSIYESIPLLQCQTDMQKLGHCEAINFILKTINKKYESEFTKAQSRLKSIVSILSPVPETKQSRRRQKRSVRNDDSTVQYMSPNHCHEDEEASHTSFWGSIWSALTCTPSYSDLAIISRHCCELADAVEKQKYAIQESYERFTSVSQTINNRISLNQHAMKEILDKVLEARSNMIKLHNATLMDLNNINERVNYLENSQQTTYNFFGAIEQFKGRAESHLNFIQNFILGVNTLFTGYISPSLIDFNEIVKVIDYVKNKLAQHSLTNSFKFEVVNSNPAFLYQLKDIVFMRTENYIIVTIKIPVSVSESLLSVYRVDKLYLGSSQKLNSSVTIESLPDFIAVTSQTGERDYFTELSVSEYATCRGSNIRICSNTRSLRTFNQLTCSIALYLNNIEKILELCDMSYEHENTPSTAIKIGDSKYLIHSNEYGPSITWELVCPFVSSNQDAITQIASCNTCILNIPCGCELKTNFFIIPLQISDCQNYKDDEDLLTHLSYEYPINLPIISSMYKPNEITKILKNINNMTIQESLHENISLVLKLKELSNYSLSIADYDDVVGERKRNSIDLKKLIKAGNKEKIYLRKVDYFVKKANDFTDLFYNRYRQIGSNFMKILAANPRVVTGISISWFLAGLAIFLSCYNLCCNK